jgi:hypothetical protein
MSRLSREKSADPVGGGCGNLVLPDSDHGPFGGAELGVVTSIPLDVSGDLRAPVGRIGPGTGAVLRAPMPEAAIDEDGHFLAPEDNVRSAAEAVQRLRVDAIAKAPPVKLRPKRKLRSGIALSVSLHGCPDRGRRGRGRFGNDSRTSVGAHSIGGSF